MIISRAVLISPSVPECESGEARGSRALSQAGSIKRRRPSRRDAHPGVEHARELFLAPGGDGSWDSVPIERRMPMFSRTQEAHWLPTDYEVRRSGLTGATSTSVSAIYRFPIKGSALEKQMLAATPRVFIEAYRLALERRIPDRQGSVVLFCHGVGASITRCCLADARR